MKLFEIKVTHYAPKGSHTSTQEYVVANSDEEVFKYLAKGYADWEELLNEDEEDEDEKTYREEEYWGILESKGDDREPEDLYYGAEKYFWEEIKLKDESVINLMIINNLAKKIDNNLEKN